jgi:phage/plasmid-like protein (TIGR03299 family)
MEALSSSQALTVSGLDWAVTQQPIYTASGQLIPNYKANVRETDSAILGVVSDRYQVVQNAEAFSFTDELLGYDVRYETAGSLQGGRRVWLLAKLPEKYTIGDDEITPYLVFSNSHDGSAAITVAMTPVRIVCMNTLNLALREAKRTWSAKHIGNIQGKLHEAQETLQLAHRYMSGLGRELDAMCRISLSDSKVLSYISELIPTPENATEIQKRNVSQVRDDIMARYFEAPDLKLLPKTAYRFINAISDSVTHSAPLRNTANYQENLFMRTLEGHPIIDKAHAMITATA